MCHANRHTRKGQSVIAPNKEKPIFEKMQKQKSSFALHFLSPNITIVLMRIGWYNAMVT